MKKLIRLTTTEAVTNAGRRFLGSRGLTIKDGHILPLTPQEIVRLAIDIPVKSCAGLWIVYHDWTGAETDFGRFRALEQPIPSSLDTVVGRELKEIRYLQPTGTPPKAYFSAVYDYPRFFAKPVSDSPLTLTEGEFKVEAAAKHGIACIGLGGVDSFLVKGSDGERELLPELARIPLEGRKVIVCYDSDTATKPQVLRARDRLCQLLEDRGALLYIRTLPQLERGEKTGLDDYLVRCGAKAWHALPLERWYGPGVPRLVALAKDDFLQYPFEQREEILRSPAACLLHHPSIVQIHAFRGVGKTNTALNLAAALACKGKPFFRWQSVRPMRVLYVEGELPGADMQRLVLQQATEATSENFHVMTLGNQPTFRFPKIVTPKGQKGIERYIEEHQIEVLFLDSLSTLANIAMNDEENQLAIGDWFMRLRTGLRVTVIYLQHDGKSGQQRGHSKHEDLLDLSMHLTWAGDYQGVEGLRAHFHIDKARRPVSDGQDMSIAFGRSLRGQVEWTWRQVTKQEEKDNDVLTAGVTLLLPAPEMSERTFTAELRKKGFTGSHKKLRGIFEAAKKLRAKSDSVSGQPSKPAKF